MPNRAPPIRRIAFVSLGCPKNLVDSERMLGLLAADGLIVTPDATKADAIVINTCGFLEASREESLAHIRQAVGHKLRGRCRRVVVAGCLVQRDKTRLLAEVPEIDRLVGVFDREHIVQAVRGDANSRSEGEAGHWLGKYHDLSRDLAPMGRVFEDDRARLRLTPRHYAYLRLSEGCNQGCTFCTIPSIRGMMRSKPLEQVLAEARELAADGAVELNLIGQDTTSYGTDIGYEPGLAGLLRALDRELKDLHWLRLMYAYPSCFTDGMIEAIAQCGRVVKYIDLPLQHINDRVLRRMRRRVTRRQTEELLAKLRRRVPGIAIRTTLIAGTPGETEAQHRELVEFVRDFEFDMLGVFAYSRERGTPMARMEEQVPEAEKLRRVEELMLTQQRNAFALAEAMAGRTVEVLVDSGDGEAWVGRTAQQAPEIDPVVHVRGRGLHVGQLATVQVTGRRGYDLEARVPGQRPRSRRLLVVTP